MAVKFCILQPQIISLLMSMFILRSGNTHWRGRNSTIDLLVLTSSDEIFFCTVILYIFSFLSNMLSKQGAEAYWAFPFSKSSLPSDVSIIKCLPQGLKKRSSLQWMLCQFSNKITPQIFYNNALRFSSSGSSVNALTEPGKWNRPAKTPSTGSEFGSASKFRTTSFRTSS